MEQPLPPFGVCCLGSVKLSSFVRNPFTKDATFDWEEYKKAISVGVRLLDNVLSVAEYPLPEIKERAINERRIGLGFTAFADMLVMLQIVYGSEESLTLDEKIGQVLRDTSYRTSIELAKEKGVFPVYSEEVFQSEFIQRLPQDIQQGIKEHGLRNIALNTLAPTGCLVPDSLVLTDKGIYTLEELTPDYQNLDYGTWVGKENISAVNEYSENKLIKNAFVNGIRNTRKIFTGSGVNLEGTLGHKFRVLEGNDYVWKSLEDMKIGDRIIYKVGGYEKATNKKMIMPDYSHFNAKPISLPEEVSPVFAYFLGLYNADGSTHAKGIRIHTNKLTEDKESVKQLIREVFDWEPSEYDNGRNCVSINISSQELLQYLEVNGLIKNKALDVNIPKAVRESSKESIIAYLKGYHFGDGSTIINAKYIDTFSKKNAQQIAITMRAVGLNSRVAEYDKSLDESSYSDNTMYRIYWRKFGSEGEEVGKYNKKSVRKEVEVLKEFGEGLFLDTVIKIEEGKNFTLDIEVPENNTYIANSYISHNTTSLSIGNNCSSGIEPIFATEYTRNVTQLDGSKIPQTVYNEAWLDYQEITGQTEKPDYFVTSSELSLDAHVKTQAVFQRYIDAAISKTIQLPDKFTFEEYQNLIMDAWKLGLKGITTYNPNGSLAPILTTEKVSQQPESNRHAKKRPESLPCDIYELTVNKQRMVVLVGKDEETGQLYEVFLTADPDKKLNLNKAKSGFIKKTKRGKYDLIVNNEVLLENLTALFDDDYAIMCRLLSLSMRHNVPLQFIVDQLNKTSRFDNFSKTVGRVLKGYLKEGEKALTESSCPDCGETVVFVEGCKTCVSCGWSKC